MSEQAVTIEITPGQLRMLAAEKAMELSTGLSNGYLECPILGH